MQIDVITDAPFQLRQISREIRVVSGTLELLLQKLHQVSRHRRQANISQGRQSINGAFRKCFRHLLEHGIESLIV